MLCASMIIYGQSIEKKWNFSSITTDGNSVVVINPSDVLSLAKGNFSYSLQAKDSLQTAGNYIYQNNLLIFNHKQPKDTVRYYNVVELTDNTLTLSEKNVVYKFTSDIESVVPVKPIKDVKTTVNQIVPSKGFSIQSLWRGVLGMFSLLIIAFLFSANRRGIDWKTVGLGLAFQLIIAIGVLKVPFVQAIFEFIGKGFVKILDFTQAGSEFLFQGLISDMDTFGFIFAFQILPTIIFFSALTSVLFYLGWIQKLVKVMALSLSKILKISGAESLSVAGNIFLGQTEAPY